MDNQAIRSEKKKKNRVKDEENDVSQETGCVDDTCVTEAPFAKPNKKKNRDVQVEDETHVSEEVQKKKKKKQRTEGETAACAEVSEESVQEPAKKKSKSLVLDEAVETYRKEHGISNGDPESTNELPAPLTSFDLLPFDAKIVKALKSAGFAAPSPIQAQSWPVILGGHDLIAVAKTGSGKTLGFLLPAFHCMMEAKVSVSNGPYCLVLAPTRELAIQINAEHERFGACVGIRSCVVYGGVPLGSQKGELKKGPHTVIATPGRLQDLINQKCICLKGAKYVVLDEADRMLDMGFEPQLKAIVGELPEGRQTLYFTATWPKSLKKLAAAYMRGDDTVHIKIGHQADGELEANKSISQEFHQVTDDEKDQKLWSIIQPLPKDARLLVFANTKRRVDYLANALWNEGLGTCAIHGDRSQKDREEALRKFTQGELPIMFATDVAARGLDIKGVTHVLNFDMARDVESYVHRIGRTGRAGMTGCSITFWNPDYDKECAPALAKIARDAGCTVPDWLEKYASVKPSKLWKTEKAVLPAAV